MSKIYSNLDSEEDLVIELGYFNNHLEVNRLDTLVKIGNILVVMFTSKANGRYVKLNCQVIDTALSTNVYNSKKGLVKKENDALHFNVMSDIYDYKKLEPHFDSIRSNLTKLTFDNIFKNTCDLLKKSSADKAVKDYLEMQFSSLKCFDRNYIDLCFKSSEEYISEEPEQNTESVDYNTNKFEYDDYE